jgi:hypothetical protein
LDDLSLIKTEYAVLTFSLDILAQSVGPDGQPVWIVIENQYHSTDHGHLGQLITYAAHAAKEQESVLAVWITEEAHPAHVAAVEFLNRSSNPVAGIGYVLLQVRFAPGPDDSYHVFFQVLASPNAFLQGGIQSGGGTASSPGLETRRTFMAKLYEYVQPAANAAGVNGTWLDPNGWQISLRFPPGSDLVRWPMEVWVRMSANDVSVSLAAYAGHTREENRMALEVVRDTVGDMVEKKRPPGTPMDWQAGQPNQATVHAMCTWGRGGYADGDVDQAGKWAAATSSAWLSALIAAPILGLADEVNLRITQRANPDSEVPADVGHGTSNGSDSG